MTSVAMELGRTDAGAVWMEAQQSVIEGVAQAFAATPVEPSAALP